jgi:hypothetical protein
MHGLKVTIGPSTAHLYWNDGWLMLFFGPGIHDEDNTRPTKSHLHVVSAGYWLEMKVVISSSRLTQSAKRRRKSWVSHPHWKLSGNH